LGSPISDLQKYAGIFRAEIWTIPEHFDAAEIEKLKKKIGKGGLRLILFSNPSNPSGHILSENQLFLLANLAENTGALLVSDEIYELFEYDTEL